MSHTCRSDWLRHFKSSVTCRGEVLVPLFIVKRQLYVAAICSVIDYSPHCLPEISLHLFQSLEVVQNEALRAEECRLPALWHRILARTAVAKATYVRRWPDTILAAQIIDAF